MSHISEVPLSRSHCPGHVSLLWPCPTSVRSLCVPHSWPCPTVVAMSHMRSILAPLSWLFLSPAVSTTHSVVTYMFGRRRKVRKLSLAYFHSMRLFVIFLWTYTGVCHLFMDLHRGSSSFYGLTQGFVIFLWTYTGVRHLFMNLHRGFSSFCGLTQGFDLHTGLSSFSVLTQGC